MGIFAPKLEPGASTSDEPFRTRAVLTRKLSMREAKKPQGAKLVRDVAQSFMNSDASGDHRLTFDEFERAVPAQMRNRSKTELRRLFDQVDADGNGFVSIDEFFIWTLNFMKSAQGSGLDDVFRRYDQRGSGTLNMAEFATAAADIGFGELANDLFVEFDPENTGTIKQGDILNTVKSGRISRNAKRLLTEIAFGGDRHAVDLDTSDWVLSGESKELIREELLVLMRNADPPARVSELFRAMAGSDKVKRLRSSEFAQAMSRVGMPVENEWLVEALFKQIDVRAVGVVGETELKAWINGVELRKAAAKTLTINSWPGAQALNLAELDWDAATIREQLQLVLISNRLGPLDLLHAWDSRGNGTFSKRDMLRMMKHFVDDLELWDDCVRDVVDDTYRSIARSDQKIDIVEFQTFLQAGWSEVKRGLQGTGTICRKSPKAVAKPEPVFGDPRWPNRVWPARRGDSAFAKRLLYRPPLDLRGIISRPVPPLLPEWRGTASSTRGQHFLVTSEGRALQRQLARSVSTGPPKLTFCYYQTGGPPVGHRPAPRLPFGGASRTCVVTYRRSASAASITRGGRPGTAGARLESGQERREESGPETGD
jgi:Ca2+-binding EF-hand superfamily protein